MDGTLKPTSERGVHFNRYDKQFKEEGIQLVQNPKRPVAAVTRELDVHDTTLPTWIKSV